MNITLDKSLSVQLNVLLFSSINWLVSYRKLDTKRRLGSVVLECLFFFCYVNVLIRQRTSSFSSEDHSFTDNASGRLLISTTGGQCPAKDGSNTEMFLQVLVQSRMRRSDFAQVHRLAQILQLFHC